jgi:SRP40, C-terminal domain
MYLVRLIWLFNSRSFSADPSGIHNSLSISQFNFAYFELADCSDSDDTAKKGKPQVKNATELQRDSSKTLSSLDDVGQSASDIDSDSDSISDSEDGKNKKQTVSYKKLPTSSSDITSSSSSDSSDEDDELEKKTNIPMRTTKPSFGPDSSSSSDSDSDSVSEPPKVNQMKRNAVSSNSDSTSDSGSESDSSESSSSSSHQKMLKKPSAVQAVTGSSSTSESSDSESEDEIEETPALSATPDPDPRVAKKRRTNEEGSAIVTATTVTVLANKARGGKDARKPNTPFQRVKVEMTEYHDEKPRDNTFEARVRPISCILGEHAFDGLIIAQAARPDDYGAKAHRDLIVTRGDGFRKEKNKKKRGSYRGGNITVSVTFGCECESIDINATTVRIP